MFLSLSLLISSLLEIEIKMHTIFLFLLICFNKPHPTQTDCSESKNLHGWTASRICPSLSQYSIEIGLFLCGGWGVLCQVAFGDLGSPTRD